MSYTARSGNPVIDVLNKLPGANVGVASGHVRNHEASTTECLASLAQIQEAKKCMAERMTGGETTPAARTSGGFGSTMASQVLGASMVAAMAFAAPPVAAALAVGQAALAVHDGIKSFSTGHAGVDGGGGGELGLSTYTDISGDTYGVASGQKTSPISTTASSSPTQQNNAHTIFQPHHMAAALDEVMGNYSKAELTKSIMEVGLQERALLAVVSANSHAMGSSMSDDNITKNYRDWNAKSTASLKPEDPKPELGLVRKSPAYAMGGMGMGSMSFG